MSINRKKNFPMTIESYTESPMHNNILPSITRNKSLAYHYNSCKQISKPNTNENQSSDPSNMNKKLVKTPQINLTNAKRLVEPAYNVHDFNSKESSKNMNFAVGKSLSVRSLN